MIAWADEPGQRCSRRAGPGAGAPRRLTSDGPESSSKRTTSVSGTGPRARGHLGLGDALRVAAVRRVGAQVHLVLLAALVVVRDLEPAHEDVQRARPGPARARPGRRPSAGRSGRPARACRPMRFESTSTDPRHGLQLRHEDVSRTCSSWSRSGPADPELDLRVVAAAEGGDGLHLGAQVGAARTAAGSRRRIAVHDRELVLLRARRTGVELHVDRAEVGRVLRVVADGHERRLDARGARARASRSTRGSSASVSRLEPSGARTLTSNCDSSSMRQEVLVRDLAERDRRRQARATMTHDDHPAVRHRPVEQRQVGPLDRRRRSRARASRRSASISFGRSQRAASIGVSVKLTSSDTAMAKAIVTPKRRHEAPDDAAHEGDRQEDGDQREGGREDGQADLPRALDRRLHRRRCFFSSMKRKMFSSTTIASSMTMPTTSASASSVMMLSVKPMQSHGREGGDDRGRDGERGDQRGAAACAGRAAR